MKIVSENSPEDIARSRALSEVESTLRDLAANILRAVRGAGKSYDLGRQAQSFILAMVAYHDAAGCYPSTHELDQALNIKPDEKLLDQVNPEENERIYAKQGIIRGALQIAASRLLQQSTQESAGDRELFDGYLKLEKLAEERRILNAKAMREAGTPPKRKPKARRTRKVIKPSF